MKRHCWDIQTASEFVTLRTEYLAKLQNTSNKDYWFECLVLEPSVVRTSDQKVSQNALEKVGRLYWVDKEMNIAHCNLLWDRGFSWENQSDTEVVRQEEAFRAVDRICGSYKNLSLQNLCIRVINMQKDLTEFLSYKGCPLLINRVHLSICEDQGA